MSSFIHLSQSRGNDREKNREIEVKSFSERSVPPGYQYPSGSECRINKSLRSFFFRKRGYHNCPYSVSPEINRTYRLGFSQ